MVEFVVLFGGLCAKVYGVSLNSFIHYLYDVRIWVLTVEQKGMWALIGTCIALMVWSTGLLYIAASAEKRRRIDAAEIYPEKSMEDGVRGDQKV